MEPATGGKGLRRGWVAITLGAWVLGALVWGGYLAYLDARGTRVGNLLRDPVEVGNLRAFAGFFSTLGIMAWAAVAGAHLMVAWAILRSAPGRLREAAYPLATGFLAVLLGFDDGLLIHEALAPNRLGIPETVMLGLYTLIAVIWTVAFFSRWDAVAKLLVVLAGVSFSLSMFYDLGLQSRTILEDGFKYLAIWTFFAFGLREAARCLAAERPRPDR
jgi:hypothetical protein